MVIDSPPVELIADALAMNQTPTQIEVNRIGEGFGFGGKVFLVTATTAAEEFTLVAKHETPDQAARVVHAYRRFGRALDGNVPALLTSSEEWTFFEHISEAQQGDGLAIETWQTEPLIRILARLHAATWSPEPPVWMPELWERERWNDQLETMLERYPDTEPDVVARLKGLHDEIPSALQVLSHGPSALVHMDSGFDNTLWRDDGSVILLDWSNSRKWSPGFDVATHLAETNPDELMAWYMDELQANGISSGDLTAHVAAAARLFIRGMVGFVGRVGDDIHPRLDKFRPVAMRDVSNLLRWLDTIPS